MSVGNEMYIVDRDSLVFEVAFESVDTFTYPVRSGAQA